MYGESLHLGRKEIKSQGLSPRVRGILPNESPALISLRSIPACTGNPGSRTAAARWSGVYPRVYGESRQQPSFAAAISGLSPRVRGILPLDRPLPMCYGSIPACTGNPPPTSAPRPIAGVYPRVYGESKLVWGADNAAQGLSPRVRGIQTGPQNSTSFVRSIPACTGNPSRLFRIVLYRRVYPRVYGESISPLQGCSTNRGLSPRVRGIPPTAGDPAWQIRSIPACTGNPERKVSLVFLSSGLSPRVRGILILRKQEIPYYGSIPACTGNPRKYARRFFSAAVYPRVYGESLLRSGDGRSGRGLSPRVRGIRRRNRW